MRPFLDTPKPFIDGTALDLRTRADRNAKPLN